MSDRADRSRIGLAVAAMVVLAMAMLLPRLGNAPMAGTEGHRVLSAHEMVQTGEWLVPHLYGRPYLRKPPLHYWCIAIAETLAGRGNELVWRIPTLIEYAWLAGLLTWAGGRLFGVRGAWGSGVAYLSIVPLWAQGRTADIDTLNNLTATLAAVAVLIGALPTKRRRIGWSVIAGLSLGASLLTKGPAGLPIVLGAMLATKVVRGDQRRRSHVLRSALVLTMGMLIALMYAATVSAWLSRHGLPLNRDAFAGLREAAENFRPDSLTAWGMAIGVPLLLVIYALPASAAGLILLRPTVRRTLGPNRSRTIVLILRTIAIAWLIGVLTGLHNPRYGYPTLPLMALLGGALWSGRPDYNDRQRSQLRALVVLVLVGWTFSIIGFATWSWPIGSSKPLLIAIIALALLVCGKGSVEVLYWRSFRGARALLVLVPLLAIAMVDWHVADRSRKSGIHAAAEIREIVGPCNPCVAGAMLRFQPELFYYAGVRCDTRGEQIPPPADIHAPTWLLLTTEEFDTVYKSQGLRLEQIIPIQSHTEAGYLVYFVP